jgi:nucleoid-associated protein YgaU
MVANPTAFRARAAAEPAASGGGEVTSSPPGQQLTLPTGPPVQPRPRIYIVRPGDTLSAIARRELGSASRWPEIFALNRDVITNPDLIVPDAVLILPT